MDKIQKTYLELLRAAIWNSDKQVEILPDEMSEVVQLAAFQGTGPLIYDQLLKMKDIEVSSGLRMQMKQQCLQSMMLQQSMIPLLSKAWSALEKADIHPVLLKGFSIAQYYPQPHLRQWGDIDIYVGQKNYHSACAVLRNTLPEAKHPKDEFEFLKHYNFVFDSTVLEMHRVSMDFHHPRDRRYYERLEELYLTKDGPKCDIDGLSVTIPEETFNLLFVFLHAWHHFTETGMNMKQLCDIFILLHSRKDYIDEARLHVILTKLHLMEVWQMIMYILVHYLNMPEDKSLFYRDKCKRRAELLFSRILSEGSSRKNDGVKCNVERVNYIKRKWITLKSRFADSQLVKPYAPWYAWHMLIGDVLHGIERTIKGSEQATNVECV